jgi:hypothetical protein
MTLNIALSPQIEARLREKAAAVGEPVDAYALRILEQAAAAPAPQIDQGTVDLLRAWNVEDATVDPGEIASRQREWDEFAASINAHHPSNRKIYP